MRHWRSLEGKRSIAQGKDLSWQEEETFFPLIAERQENSSGLWEAIFWSSVNMLSIQPVFIKAYRSPAILQDTGYKTISMSRYGSCSQADEDFQEVRQMYY